MNNLQTNPWINSKNITVLLLGIVITYFLVASLVDARFNKIEDNTRELISEQESLLTAIAEATARNGADSVTELIVKDCTLSERVKFDDLLGRLNNISNRTELVELERLFGRCGSFFSERKTVMVSRLSREVEIYGNYVNQLNVILDEDLSEKHSLKTWQELAAEEKKQSELFTELVALQDRIITTLLSGKSANSEEITGILQEVNEVQETLVVVNLQTSNVRSRLNSL